MHQPRPQTVTGGEMETRLVRALEPRALLLAAPDTTCCRLVNGVEDGLPGVVVERFGPVVIVQDRSGSEPLVTELVAALGRLLGPGGRHDLGLTAVYVKRFVQDRSHRPDDKTGPLYDPQPAWGTPTEPEITVSENGLPFLIHPYDGYSVGLFLDQRNNRLAVRQSCAGCRVLNTFCYTGAFHAAALAGGASRVVGVDVSKKYLDWARRNFDLWSTSILPVSYHAGTGGAPVPQKNVTPEFFAIPIFDFFRAARNRGETYDRIILDPPSFGRDKKGQTFSAEHDYLRLLREAWELLPDRGQVWACTNHSQLDEARFLRLATAALTGQRFGRLDVPPPPPDFPGKLPPLRTLRLEKR